MTGCSIPVPQVTRVGKALALFRARVQRFTDDRASHALASELEARYVDGLIPSPATIGSLERYLQALREQPSPPFDASEVAKIEGVDLEQAVAQRDCWRAATRDTRAARVVVVVVGSPRSGSSYLYNLLATQPGIATFTSVSSPYWSAFDLVHPRGRTTLAKLGPRAHDVDTRTLKLCPELIVPSESEDILNRAIPVAEHVAGHHYRIVPSRIAHRALLLDAVSAHLAATGARVFATKSPFSSFRIRHLVQVFGSRARFVHIHRNGYDVRRSIAENRFRYDFDAALALTATSAWAGHVEAVLRDAPASLVSVALDDLRNDTDRTLARLFAALGLPPPLPIGPSGHATRPAADDPAAAEIDRWNAHLGYRRMDAARNR